MHTLSHLLHVLNIVSRGDMFNSTSTCSSWRLLLLCLGLPYACTGVHAWTRHLCNVCCSIPITIRNFFKPEAPGTVIGDFVTAEDGSGGQFVKGFATIDDVALINVEV